MGTIRHPAERLFYDLALRGLHRAQAIIAISEFTRQTLIQSCKILPEKIRVIYRCIDTRHFRPLPIPDEFLQKYGLKRELQYILYVGSEDPRKNLGTLVEAFAMVRHELPNVRLLKAGAAHFPEQREKLLRQIAQLGLGDQVLFLDHVPEEDLPQLYNASSVFVLPSWYEGFGLPALEAMACGIPAVVSNASSLPEVVGPEGRLFAPGDATALADHLLRLLRDPGCRREAGLKALARAQAFSLANQAQATLQVYKEVSRKT
jgi:glycosyltransferase involved in cell wall biosynthesis